MTADSAFSARAYHEATKHRRGELAPSRRVDAALVPKQYKRYVGLPEVALPAPLPTGGTDLDAGMLSSLLHYTAGIVRRREVGGRALEFRAASCTGALYHVEVYVVCGDLGDVAAGVYHYDVPSETLRRLREGDYRAHLAASCAEEDMALRPMTLVFTSMFWRNAWRYEERAYRHVFWDTGTMLANLLALADERGLEARALAAFVDDEVNVLLGVDPVREAAVCVVPLGALGATPAGDVGDTSLRGISPEMEALSRVEIEYPLIWRAHEAANLPDAAAVSMLRARTGGAPVGRKGAYRRPSGGEPIADVIERRVSGRRFGLGELARSQMVELLAAATAPVPFDLTDGGLVDTLMLVHAVEGLDAGVYRAAQGGLRSLRAGEVRAEATALALDQDAAGDAALNVYFVASMGAIESRLGDRGYRAVQLEAGVRCGRVYLAATARGLKATGLTFYDDAVASALGLDAGDAAVLMLVAVGPPGPG